MMDNNWQTKQLGEVLEYEQPTQYIVSSKSYKNEYETPVLTAGKTFILGKTKEKKGIFPVAKLPVIIFDDFTTATQFVDFPFKVKSSAMKILHPVKEVADAKFLFYMMQNIAFDHTRIHRRYWISEYSNIKVPVPPISEQKQIVKKLDEVFENIVTAKTKIGKNLQNSRELFESALQATIAKSSKNFEQRDLASICTFQRGLTYSKKDEVEFSKNVVLRSTNIDLNSHSLTFRELRYISDEIQIPQSMRAKKGALLVCTANGSKKHLGKIALIDKNYGYAFGGFMGQIIPNKEMDSDYLFFILTSQKYNDYIASLSSGANINNLRFDQLGQFTLPIPPLDEQKLMSRRLGLLSIQTKKLEKIYELKLADLEELKKSVLARAFTGAL